MQVSTGKLQILTAAAILVLISGGIAAYAQGQSGLAAINSVAVPSAMAGADATSTSTSSTSSSSTSTVTSTVTSTATVTATSTTSAPNATLCTPSNVSPGGRIVLPIGPPTSTTSTTTGSITFSNNYACRASITTVGGIFSVNVMLRYAKPVTQYNVVLVANGTSYTLGNMVTGLGGTGQLSNQVLLKPGTYVVYLQIFDTSSDPGHSILVLQSAQGTIVSGPFPTPAAAVPGSPGNQSGGHGDK